MSDPALAAGADRVGFLSKGRLVLDEDVRTLIARFRRIHYVNEVTETRTEYGTELDRFDAVRVKVRGWGVDAVVSNFDEAEFERLRKTEGVGGARALPMNRRDFGIGGQILRDLGLRRLRVLTNNPQRLHHLQAFGLEVVGTVHIDL